MNHESTYRKQAVILLCVLALVGPSCNLGTEPNDDTSGIVRFTLTGNPSPVENPGIGKKTSVDIVVENAYNLIAARFVVTFDPAVLEAAEIYTTGQGYLFENAGATVLEMERVIDNDAGRIVLGIGAVRQGFTGASGDGALATITFTVKTGDTTVLRFPATSSGDIVMSVYSEDADSWNTASVQTADVSIVGAD